MNADQSGDRQNGDRHNQSEATGTQTKATPFSAGRAQNDADEQRAGHSFDEAGEVAAPPAAPESRGKGSR